MHSLLIKTCEFDFNKKGIYVNVVEEMLKKVKTPEEPEVSETLEPTSEKEPKPQTLREVLEERKILEELDTLFMAEAAVEDMEILMEGALDLGKGKVMVARN